MGMKHYTNVFISLGVKSRVAVPRLPTSFEGYHISNGRCVLLVPLSFEFSTFFSVLLSYPFMYHLTRVIISAMQVKTFWGQKIIEVPNI